MRCGKETRFTVKYRHSCRNPHECAVAKKLCPRFDLPSTVATRTNALWQSTFKEPPYHTNESQPARMRCGKDYHLFCLCHFATSQPARMRCGKAPYFAPSVKFSSRNPHECAVAKRQTITYGGIAVASQPARMRCGKEETLGRMEAAVRVATRANALRQRLSANASGINIKSQPARMR